MPVDLGEYPPGNLFGDAVSLRAPSRNFSLCMATRCSLLGLENARRTSSASAALMPATSSMSWTTCSCQNDDPVSPLQGGGAPEGWSYSHSAPCR